jgi:hypothetical protein
VLTRGTNLERYEAIGADALGAMRHSYFQLRISIDEGQLFWEAKKHSLQYLLEKGQGEGKIPRKASLGRWREDRGPEQVEKVERIITPLLEEFYLNGIP